MAAITLSGTRVAADEQRAVRGEVEALRPALGRSPGLAVVLVGENPASEVYVRNKRRACATVGISSHLEKLPEETEERALLELIATLNEAPDIDGILVQLPLPRQIAPSRVLDAIHPLKDVDAFHPENVGLLMQGRPRFLPCTPAGVQRLLVAGDIPCAGRHVVILGRSDIVGRPLSMMLSQKTSTWGPDFANATVTLCHSRSTSLAQITRQAEILVAAVGVPRFVSPEMIRPGATVIDVGIHRAEDGLCGDVDFSSVSEVAGSITPVPGGVGPMTIAMLLRNAVQAAALRIGSRTGF